MMLVHRCRIDRLDVPARAIFSLPAVYKREALMGRGVPFAADQAVSGGAS